jgi:SAM-dependent methyltransferase
LKEAEFDRFADEYYTSLSEVIATSGETPEYFAAYKVQDVARIAEREDIVPARILDFGSGIGSSIPHFRNHFAKARVVCADISQRSLEIAKTRFPGDEIYAKIEGDTLGVEDGTVDISFSACVFHHIPPAEHRHWLCELSRVVRPGGMLFVFEHNPFNPLTVRAVRTCPYDENAILIRASRMKTLFRETGWKSLEVRYRLFFPGPLAALRPLERFFGSVALGAQYVVCGRKE